VCRCRPRVARSCACATGAALRAASLVDKSLWASAAAVLDASEPNVQVAGAPAHGSLSQDWTARLALGALKAFMSLTEVPARVPERNRNLRIIPTTSATTAGGAYLAVLIEPSRPTPRYDISLLRNRASNFNGTAIPLHTDCVTLLRSTAAEPSCVRCKQCARPSDADAIERVCAADRAITELACRLHFRSSFNCGTTIDVAELRICEGDAGVERQSASML
jgi:hypothetical protein